MALMRCSNYPACQEITGDFPNVAGTEPDGTAIDKFPCLDCVCAELDGYSDDAA